MSKQNWSLETGVYCPVGPALWSTAIGGASSAQLDVHPPE